MFQVRNKVPSALRHLLRALLFVLAAAAGWAAAQAQPSLVWPGHDNITGRAWVDESGAATLESARRAFDAGLARPATSRTVMPFRTGRAVWFRLDIPAASQPIDAVFAIAYSGIDRVELFRPDGRGGWRREVAGDSVAVRDWPMRYLYPAFTITLRPGEVQPIWLRVQHDYPIAVKWVLRDAGGFNESSQLWHLVLGACAGLMLLVIVLCLAHAVQWRDPIHLYYAIHVLLVGTSLAALTGLAGEYLWPGNAWWNDMSCVVLPIAALGWMGVFVRELVAERGKRLLSWLLLAHAAIAAALIVAFLALGRQAFFEWPNVYAVVSLPFLVGVLAWFSLRRPRVGLWVLSGMGLLVASTFFPVLRNLGVLPVTFATQYAPQIGGVLEIPLMLVGLYFRSRERRDNRMRIDALSHTDPLTGVGNHRVLIERLQRLLRRAERDPLLGGVLRVHVLNLPAIRAEYGREAAEAAMVRAAECVALEAGDGDLVAREQGGDLVLLMEGKVSREQASEAARNIIARGLKFSARLPPSVTLALRITGMCAPLPVDDAPLFLATLQCAMQELVTQQSGRAIRILQRGPGAVLPGAPGRPRVETMI
ncbi:MAG TPA: 7TM diverse intracellular signaling domain-containing protein [Ramlibacter sp.]|nr:7TM diverse intracellular signaling domain-containing protein [Ramlibacter sp.]